MRLTDRVVSHWFIDYLVAHGVPVEYWDVSEALRDAHDDMGAIARPYVRRFATLHEVEAALRTMSMDGAIFMMMITYTGHFTSIFRLLSRHGARMWVIVWGHLPTSPAPAWKKLLERVTSPLWLAVTAYYIVKARLFRKLRLVDEYDVVFAAGRVALRSEPGASRCVAINSVDYDAWRRSTREAARIAEGSYAVFLDINLPYQTDLSVVGLRPVQPEPYFASLNRLFAVLETVYGVRIVIALHPKATYGSEKFDGREAHRGVTADLVRDARFVVTHTSTAMSYAVLNHKPLLFVFTEEMERIYRNNLMQEMRNYARFLDAPLVRADDVGGAADVPLRPVNEERYEMYKYDFLTSPECEAMETREIVLRELRAPAERRGPVSAS